MASSYVGGLSGAFIPVSEDQGMIDAVTAGALSLEKLEAMTCVCSVGLDMIAIPGDTKATTISGIIADEMAIGMINQKTTAVRIIPVIGKGVGETVEFGGLLGYAPIMPVNKYSCDAFINRGGRIPDSVREAQGERDVAHLLTPRERDVLRLLVEGNTSKEIAHTLGVEISTVISHRKNLAEKMGTKNMAALTIFAVTHGIVKAEDI